MLTRKDPKIHLRIGGRGNPTKPRKGCSSWGLEPAGLLEVPSPMASQDRGLCGQKGALGLLSICLFYFPAR